MSDDVSNIISVPPPGGDFQLWPFLDTLYRWVETQPGFAEEALAAWRAFAPGAEHATALPDAREPDEHDRLLRFWSHFALERPGASGDRPIDRFLAAHASDLTPEG